MPAFINPVSGSIHKSILPIINRAALIIPNFNFYVNHFMKL
ncbi:hypothetical protein KP77_16630 [Jeotgalibacillus alimentarius]|uniref:Uncharacterized protein n=1 Tax=Jeotgalibacillus alimentarius TaxID=135826 RepID=A0A0C2VMZ9_9BACL|nr:hypothetical protein KP77_16630 [Jeotgalibacillus alimentarius]